MGRMTRRCRDVSMGTPHVGNRNSLLKRCVANDWNACHACIAKQGKHAIAGWVVSGEGSDCGSGRRFELACPRCFATWAWHPYGHPHRGGLFVTVPVGHRKRCRRIDEPGHAHALTFSCFRRQPFLSKDRSRQWLVEGIERAREKHQFDLWAWVIMPEHAHLLVCPRKREYSISSILTTIKQSVAKRSLVYVRQHAPAFLSKMEDRQPNGNVSYRFWQRGGGYDRNLIEPRTIWAEIEYLHANQCGGDSASGRWTGSGRVPGKENDRERDCCD
jgi:putative transposase